MTVIVKGHGARMDDTMTFAPTGTTIKMFSGYDLDLSTSAALIAITSGKFGSPNDSAAPGDDIANYELGNQDDGFYAKWYAMGAEASTPIWWVGSDLDDGIRLCNEDGTCDKAAGTHDCSGVFGKVKDAEIILLACRGYVEADDAAGASPNEYGTDTEDPLYDANKDMDKWLTDFMERVKADPTAAEAEYDSLPQGTQALLLSRGDGNAFSLGRWVRYFAEADDMTGLFNHLKQNAGSSGNIMWLLDAAPAYGAALDAAAGRHPGEVKDFIDLNGNPWADALNGRPGIVSALQAVDAAEGTTVLEWEAFVQISTDAVKALGEGDGASFWHLGDVLVVGGQYRGVYGTSLLDGGGSEGTITMLEKGGTFSSGKVEISGATDQAGFKKAFGKLSNKSVKFV
jgi:hypothetical protein